MMTISLPTIHPTASVAMQNLHMSIKEPFCCCQDIKVRIESMKASERYVHGPSEDKQETYSILKD